MKTSRPDYNNDTRLAFAIKIGLPLAGIAAIVAFIAALFSQQAASDRTNDIIDTYCTPSGGIQVATQNASFINPHWDPELFLSITFGFGQFTYAAAKGIDVVWDLVIGRLGQVFLAVLAYPVLRRSLATCMEVREVHFPVYASLAFDKVSLASLSATTRDLFGRKKADSRRSVLFSFDWRYFSHALVLTYILGFPTMVSVHDWLPGVFYGICQASGRRLPNGDIEAENTGFRCP